MYTIKAYVDGKEYTIHDARVKVLTVGGNPYFEIGDNINGSATFKVFPTHPYYDKVKKLTTDIVIYRDDESEFYGRVLYDDEDFSGTKKVFVEGELAFLCDSIQRPKVYHNISVKAYVQDLIDIHNAQVEERKQFVVGRVTVKDSNDSLYRYSNYEDTRTAFKEKLTSRLGGHLVIRHEDGLRILDYLADEDYYTKNTQGIRFGKNLLDFSKNMDASDLATCIIPLGAKLDEEDQDPALEAISDQRLTIASVNGGVDYVTDDNAVREYGKIYKTVTWDDVTVPENLKKKAEEYLKSVQFEKMVLELKAIDLNLTDESFQRFEVGNMIQCVSTPNGLDREFPLTKKKVYITSFKNNTVTLGDETSAKSYTSSNRQSTAEIEETIKSLPSKTEILQEALRSAQDLINKQVASGYAVHVPNEFIVADDVDYKNKAKNLWRWGLGGFAHYSQGYAGPIDGVALTMDGKINGEMLLVNSVKTEALDAGYRTSVETKISKSETAANEYADNKVRVAKETIENSISNLENKISLSVRSVKETVARKNYIVGGEQETLTLSKFTLSGAISICTIESAEFLNKKAFKLTFSGTGAITLTQSLGTLEAGNYKIAVEAAYPEGTKYRPSYIQYGFSENKSTAYLSGYTADEFHAYSKDVKITEGAKSVAVTIYGEAGNILYVTDIRCLRDIQELLDDSKSQLQLLKNSIEAEVERATDGEEKLATSIKLNTENITQAVKKGEFGSYVTQYYDRVITAFNNSSKYVQITAGEIAVYDNGVETSKKRAAFDQDGNHFWRDGYYVGKIGTNKLNADNSKKGINFDLEWQGAYMTWAAQDSSGASTYSMKWTYVQKNKGWSDYTAGRLHAGCDIDMHYNTLRNVSFEDGAINGTLRFVQIISMNSDGTANEWSNNCLMQFKNGILIKGTWNG